MTINETLLARARALIARGYGSQAEGLLRLLVAKRMPGAFAPLGRLVRHGLGKNLQPNFAEAYRLFLEGDRLGDSDATVQLAFCVGNGLGCEHDEARAFELALKAAERGNRRASAVVALATMQGRGCPKDAGRARKFLEDAAAEEVPELQYELGRQLLMDEPQSDDNTERAMQLIRNAAMGGYVDACKGLAQQAYQEGRQDEFLDWMSVLNELVLDSDVPTEQRDLDIM